MEESLWNLHRKKLCLTPQTGSTSYQTVRDFYARFNQFSTPCVIPNMMLDMIKLTNFFTQWLPIRSTVQTYQKNMEGWPTVSAPRRELAVMSALEENLVDVAFHISRAAPFEHYSVIIKAAIKQKQWEMIPELLAKLPEDKKTRFHGHALMKAADAGSLDAVQMLLKEGSISGEYLGKAIFLAIGGGRRDIVEAVLQKCPEGPIFNDRSAILFAVKKGLLDILRLLIPGDRISENNCGMAVCLAADSGSLDALKILFQYCHKGLIFKKLCLTALYGAADKGHLECFKLLLQEISFMSKDCIGVAVTAYDQGRLKIVEILSQQGLLHLDARGLIVVGAATKGAFTVVKMLLQKGPISEQDSHLAISEATRRGHLDIVELLKKK
jgi:ankyrin repeat protein